MMAAPLDVAMVTDTVSGRVVIFDLLSHYSYPELDEGCRCRICQSWRDTQEIYFGYLKITEDHRLGCRCDDCRSLMRARSGYLAATNRRNLFCELSWHATQQKHGIALMRWLWGQIVEQPVVYNDRFWEHNGAETPLISWFREFSAHQRGLGMAVSGVF